MPSLSQLAFIRPFWRETWKGRSDVIKRRKKDRMKLAESPLLTGTSDLHLLVHISSFKVSLISYLGMDGFHGEMYGVHFRHY